MKTIIKITGKKVDLWRDREETELPTATFTASWPLDVVIDILKEMKSIGNIVESAHMEIVSMERKESKN